MLVKFGAFTELFIFGVVCLFDDDAGENFWAAKIFPGLKIPWWPWAAVWETWPSREAAGFFGG